MTQWASGEQVVRSGIAHSPNVLALRADWAAGRSPVGSANRVLPSPFLAEKEAADLVELRIRCVEEFVERGCRLVACGELAARRRAGDRRARFRGDARGSGFRRRRSATVDDRRWDEPTVGEQPPTRVERRGRVGQRREHGFDVEIDETVASLGPKFALQPIDLPAEPVDLGQQLPLVCDRRGRGSDRCHGARFSLTGIRFLSHIGLSEPSPVP